MSDQGGSDAPVLPLRKHTYRTEHLDGYQLLGRVEQTAGEHDMPENLAGIIRNEREWFRVVSSQCGYQLRDDGTVISEGLPVYVENCLEVAGALGPEVHVR